MLCGDLSEILNVMAGAVAAVVLVGVAVTVTVWLIRLTQKTEGGYMGPIAQIAYGILVGSIVTLIIGDHLASARIDIPNLTVMAPGEHMITLDMPTVATNGRRVFIEGVSFSESWTDERGIVDETVQPVTRSVVFPKSFTGRIEVTIRHIPGGAE